MRGWCSAIVVGAALALGAGAAPAGAVVLWSAGAEPGTPTAWKQQQEARFDRVRGDSGHAAEGVASFRFELRDGERRKSDPSGIERAELAVAIAPDGEEQNLRAGDTAALAWSQWFDPRFPTRDTRQEDEWCVFFQLKESEDSGSPLISMSCGEGRQALDLGREHHFDKPWSEPIVRGRWQRFVLRVHLSTGRNGWLELSRDGERVARVRGQTIRRNTDVYLKAGIYRNAAIQGTAITYADAFRLRTATSSPLPEPPVISDVAAALQRLRSLL